MIFDELVGERSNKEKGRGEIDKMNTDRNLKISRAV